MYGAGFDGRLGFRGRVRRLALAGALFVCCAVRSARAEDAPSEVKVAVGFSNLVARLDKDEIGFAKPEYRVYALEALRAAGFNAVGAENLVFNKDDADKADLVLGGTVKELECRTIKPAWVYPPDVTVRCRIGIEWQLLDRERDEVVYRVMTRFAALNFLQNDPVLGRTLTLGALSSLLQRPRFRELLSAKHAALPDEAEYPPATFKLCDAQAHELPADFDSVADGTVVVKSGGGLGSGFFVSSDGLVMTAAHVVAAGTVEVRLRGGKSFAGRVLRISHKQDVALIALGAAARPSRCLAFDPTPQTPGTDVYAIGSPATEELAFSLSRGIVSGLRTIADVSLLQTDASVSPGNSGGALVDPHGRVVGVVSRKIAGHAVEGLGFAIPIQTGLAALHLEPAALTSPAFLEQEPAAIEHSITKPVPLDVPDRVPSLDPEGDRRALERADYERRVQERRDRTPVYVTPMRWGGVAVASVGALVALVTSADNEDRERRAAYQKLRLENDLGWVAMALGSGAFVTSFILTPSLGPSKIQSAQAWSLRVGPGAVRMDVAF